MLYKYILCVDKELRLYETDKQTNAISDRKKRINMFRLSMSLPDSYSSSLAFGFVWTVQLNPKNSRTSSSSSNLLTEHTAEQTLLVSEKAIGLYEMSLSD